MALGPQFEQLQMLMTGSELQNMITESFDRMPVGRSRRRETMRAMWNRKANEARGMDTSSHGAGVYSSLKEKGYVGEPLNIWHQGNRTILSDGHHRVAAAAELERQNHTVYIPVEHNE